MWINEVDKHVAIHYFNFIIKNKLQTCESHVTTQLCCVSLKFSSKLVRSTSSSPPLPLYFLSTRAQRRHLPGQSGLRPSSLHFQPCLSIYISALLPSASTLITFVLFILIYVSVRRCRLDSVSQAEGVQSVLHSSGLDLAHVRQTSGEANTRGSRAKPQLGSVVSDSNSKP